MNFFKRSKGNIGPQSMTKLQVSLVARNAKGKVTGRRCLKDDLATKQFAQFIQANILNTGETIKDTSNSDKSISANSDATVPRIVAGIGTTPADVTDYCLESATAGTSGYAAATINAYSGTGTSGTFTITGTITNSSGVTIAYAEVGVTIVSATFTFLLCHDIFTALNVSDGGTLAVTYTATLGA